MDDRPGLLSESDRPGNKRLAASLVGNGTRAKIPDARHDIGEAIRLAREIHSPPEEAWADWSLGLLYTVYGQFGDALEIMQTGLQIATEIGHREWVVGNQFALGVLLVELYAPEKARLHLEQALVLAKGLRSQYWIHHVTGALIAAHIVSGDLKSAQSSLDSVLSSQTPMDTMGKRYCWARRAQLALAQGDPALALDIVERLIETAPGKSADCVITFLWKLKGETLAEIGLPGNAVRHLQDAIENARKQGEQFLLWRTHASLGRFYRKLGSDKESFVEFATACVLIEELAASIPDPALKHGFMQGANQAIDYH